MKKRKRTNAPGQSHRRGLTVMELLEMFPDEPTATQWFESVRWEHGRFCGSCGAIRTGRVRTGRPMPYWCKVCKSYFSVRTGTPMESSRIPLRKWGIAIYLLCTNLKGISSLRMHREIGISQKSAWFMVHRIREGLGLEEDDAHFREPVEVDEAYMGGKESNKHASRKLRKGRGSVGKTAVVGIKTRNSGQVYARTVESTDRETLHGIIRKHVRKGERVFTDEATAYKKLHDYRHKSVKHSVGQYVDEMAHTNGMESFWSMLKRGYHGTYHKMSPKHLDRYCNEFAGRHNIRHLDTIEQMEEVVRQMNGRALPYEKLVGKDL